ncbi:MAG: hypothetical protein WKG07_20875 [Hymenobacter sp.]
MNFDEVRDVAVGREGRVIRPDQRHAALAQCRQILRTLVDGDMLDLNLKRGAPNGSELSVKVARHLTPGQQFGHRSRSTWRPPLPLPDTTLAVPQDPAVVCCGATLVSPIAISSFEGSIASSRTRTCSMVERMPWPISCPAAANRVVPSAFTRSVTMLGWAEPG